MPRKGQRSMTEFNQQVLEYVEDFYTENLYPPTIREIIDGIGRGSTSSVSYALQSLAENGFLRPSSNGEARTQVPTYKPRHPIPISHEYRY